MERCIFAGEGENSGRGGGGGGRLSIGGLTAAKAAAEMGGTAAAAPEVEEREGEETRGCDSPCANSERAAPVSLRETA